MNSQGFSFRSTQVDFLPACFFLFSYVLFAMPGAENLSFKSTI